MSNSRLQDLRAIYVAYDLSGLLSGPAATAVEVAGSLGFGKYGYLGQWCKGAGFDAKTRTAYLAQSPECKPFTAQIVGTTTTGRVLVGGTGLDGIVELRGGRIVGRFANTSAGAGAANVWTGSADGGPVAYTHLYHGVVYDATREGAGAGGFQPLAPWDPTTHPMGPLSPHAFPTMRPSEAAVDVVAAWVPPSTTCCCSGAPCPGCKKCIPTPPASTTPDVVFDFGQNFAGTAELTVTGPTAALRGLGFDLRYGETLMDGPEHLEELYHPWWPCTLAYRSQGAHNCANQTDRYILRGSPGAVGPMTALGRVPMMTAPASGGGGLAAAPPPLYSAPVGAETFMASHAIKGGRYVSLTGSAFYALLNGSKGSGIRFGNDACFPAAGVGRLEPCKTPRQRTDVVITLRMWPLHSDVAIRSAVKLHPRREGSVPASVSAAVAAADDAGWSVANVNRLQGAIVRTHLNNLHSIPQDCPHREQRGWGGDAQLTAGSAALNLDMSAFYRNWVTSMLDLQSIGDGDLPSYVPRDPRQGDKAPTWAAIAVSVPWEYWARTGDASMLPLGLNTTKRLIDFWQKHLDTAGLVTLGVYGDWAESPRAGPKNEWSEGAEMPRLLVEHSTYLQCLDRGADMADAVGESHQAGVWRDQAAAARAAIEKRWFNTTSGCYAQSCAAQSAQAAPFALNVTAPEHRVQAIAGLVGSVTHWNTSYIVGIVGMRFIHDALAEAGYGGLALQLIGRDSAACTGTVSCTFSQWLERGPGTLWEQWDYTELWGGSSANHIMFGGGPGVFIHRAAGVLPAPRWSQARAEVAFALDASIAAVIGGADLWSEGPRGEVMLRWRWLAGERSCVSVEVAGPSPRPGHVSWQLSLPEILLAEGTARGIEVTGAPDVAVTKGGAGLATLRPTSGGSVHSFMVC